MLKMLTHLISIYFQRHLIQIKRELYCLEFISCSNQSQGPLGRVIQVTVGFIM